MQKIWQWYESDPLPKLILSLLWVMLFFQARWLLFAVLLGLVVWKCGVKLAQYWVFCDPICPSKHNKRGIFWGYCRDYESTSVCVDDNWPFERIKAGMSRLAEQA